MGTRARARYWWVLGLGDDALPNRRITMKVEYVVHGWNIDGASFHWSQGLSWSAGITDILKYRVSSFRYCVLLTAS